jgi:SAM-dependent methyltransferase
MAPRAASAALDRAIELLTPAARPASPDTARGYLDLLGGEDPTGAHPGQRLMTGRALPMIYERLWRPVGGRVLLGAIGPGMADERRIALELLGLSAGDRVLDVGCGPGNFTRLFARGVTAEGLVVGLDASATMLDRALQEGVPRCVAYVRGDAAALPFADGAFDAVCCFAALYLIADPFGALDEIARVLAPGGRVAILTSCHRGPVPTALARPAVRALTGVRLFGRGEVTGALRERGLRGERLRVAGLGQFVGASRPARRSPAAR